MAHGPDLFAEIARLKKEKNAVILAHYYQEPDIQDVADFVGDSLELARAAEKSTADLIVFAGVHFMAEGAKIMNPTRKVVMPDLRAGCSLSDSCPPQALERRIQELTKAGPRPIVISYINCSTEVKDLYWLYNFFFFIHSAMLGGVFFGKLAPHYESLVSVLGILLALYWLSIIRKQRMWRNDWVEKIQLVEEKLGYEKDLWMWKYKANSTKTVREYVLGKRGLWHWLFILPIGFAVMWLILLVS
jgi:hypothetical protein